MSKYSLCDKDVRTDPESQGVILEAEAANLSTHDRKELTVSANKLRSVVGTTTASILSLINRSFL